MRLGVSFCFNITLYANKMFSLSLTTQLGGGAVDEWSKALL